MLSGVLQSAKKKIREVQHEMDIYRLRKATVNLGNVSSVHLSLDDVHQVFIDAQRLHPDSLFDLPLLSELKRLNELYGAKFTLYCFEDSAYRLSEECFAELKANENWLQVGYHGGIDGKVTVESYQRFRSYFSEQKIKLASSLRLHYFDCPEELKGVLSADGVRRLFCSDEGRDSYGLVGKIYGGYSAGGITYLPTDIRLEHYVTKILNNGRLCAKEELIIFGHEIPFMNYREFEKLEAIIHMLPTMVEYEL